MKQLYKVLIFMVATCAVAGHVEWSDGVRQEGELQAGPNGVLRLHDGVRVREWRLEEVARVTLRLEKGRLERAWRFVEAGQTQKEEWGEPYPVAELMADVWLKSGTRVAGHLMSTTLYLDDGEGVERVVVKRKLRGAGGESVDDLRYPVELVFGGEVVDGGGWRWVKSSDGVLGELAMVSRRTMNSAAVRRKEGGWEVMLEGGDVVAALRDGKGIRVGWRGGCDEAELARLRQGLVDLNDFFDGRELVAAAVDEDDKTVVHTLLLLHRVGKTTLPARASQPWRLEVWRWRLGEGDDISAARRVVLFRGIKGVEEALPLVRVDERLVEMGGGVPEATPP